MFTTRSLSSWVVLSSTTDLLILRHKIDYVTSLNVDFRREYHKNSVLPPYGRQQLLVLLKTDLFGSFHET